MSLRGMFCTSLPLCLCAALLMSGCSTSFQPAALTDDPVAATQTPIGEITGTVHGGQFPVTGAQIYLFAAATSGYAGASTSLITSGKSGVSCTNNNTGVPTGACYVTTDGNGNFSLANDYTCTAGTEVYMVASGGNPGMTTNPVSTTATYNNGSTQITVASTTGVTVGKSVSGTGLGGTVTAVNTGNKRVTLSQATTSAGNGAAVTFFTAVNNTAIAQMVGLGHCPSTGTMAQLVPYLVINEITTVSFAYAMGGFGTDAYHIGSSGTAQAKIGIANAMANSYNIVGIGWGGGLTQANGNPNSTAPQAKIYALANILGTCVNTSSSTSTQCTNLFSAAKSSSNVVATDEANAIFNIAHNPANTAANTTRVSSIWALDPSNPLFVPTPPATNVPSIPVTGPLTTAPTDWTLPVVYKTAVSRPSKIAFDSTGTAWIADRTLPGVVSVGPMGAVKKITLGSAGSSIYDVAVDSNDTVWAVDFGKNQVYRLDNSGNLLSTINTGGLSSPSAISFDSSGTAYVANSASTTISRFDNSGNALSPWTTNGGLGTPFAIAVDTSGNLWLPSDNMNCGCLVELTSGNTVGTLFNNLNFILTGNVGDSTAVAVDGSNVAWQANTDNELMNLHTLNLFGQWVFNTVDVTGGGMNAPATLSVDGGGNLWMANSGAATVSGFSNTGTALASAGLLSGGTGKTYAAAPDLSGNLWTANSDGTVVQLLGVATPTATPVVPGQFGSEP